MGFSSQSIRENHIGGLYQLKGSMKEVNINSLHQWSLNICRCNYNLWYPWYENQVQTHKRGEGKYLLLKKKITSASRFFLNWSSASTANGSPTPYNGRRNLIMPQSNNCLSGYAHLALSQYSELTSDRTFICNSASCQKRSPCQQGHSYCHFSVAVDNKQM